MQSKGSRPSVVIILLLLNAAASVLIANIYFNHNVVEKKKDGSVIAKKIDGLFSYTKVRFKGKDVEVWRSAGIFRKPVHYTDMDGDGKVDVLTLWPGNWMADEKSVTVARENGYGRYSGDFKDADIGLKEQLKRFSGLVEGR